MRQDLDTSESGRDNERRGVGTGRLLVGESEILAVIWNNHADKEDAEAVEDENTEEGKLDGCGNPLVLAIRKCDWYK